MFGLVKSDLYKLFRMKSFYICGALAAVFSGLLIFLLNLASSMQYNRFYGEEYAFVSPYTGVYSLSLGLSFPTLFIIIVASMFTQSEFKFGTIKNIVSRGFARPMIYLSKYISTIFISVVYTLICVIVTFGVGSILAGVGEFNRAIFLDILEIFGLSLLAQLSLQSIFQMVCFISHSTGWAMVTNLVIYMFLPDLFSYINLLVNNWLASAIASVDWLSSWIKIDNFSVAKYWPLTYVSEFTNIDYLHIEFFNEILVTGLIVCVAYMVVSLLLGVLAFRKRDID